MTFNTYVNNTSSLNQTREDVMVENNAQTIFEHIKSLGNDPKNRQRWIWELMQNVQDTNGNIVDIKFIDNVLMFSHNGDSFTEKDITHLIYHGSAKHGLEGKTGKFGTGFMTTHLLSKRVRIKGNLSDGRYFNFELNREAKDADEMTISLSNSWNNFISSIGNKNENKITSFTYIDLTQEGITTVQNVLDNVHLLIPFVLAFSGKIEKITIHYNDEEVIYEKVETNKKNEVSIKCSKSFTAELIYHNLILRDLKGNKGKIAIPINNNGDFSILDPRIPRLFITFPLIGTNQAFPLPFLINSQNFEPSPEREKLWLSTGTDTLETRINKDIIQTALDEYILSIREFLSQGRINIHLLANLGQFNPIEWVDEKWYKELLLKVIKEIDDLPLMIVAKLGAEKISLSTSHIPFTELSDTYKDEKRIWDLCNYLFPDKIPSIDQAEYWRKILLDRKSFFEDDSNHPSAFTLKKVCRYIDTIPENRLTNIQTIDINGIDFLQFLILTLEDFKLENYWNEFAILPDQTNILRKSSVLRQELLNTDQEIGDTLKNISEGLNNPIRIILLHQSIFIKSENHKLSEYKKEFLVTTLLQKARNTSFENIQPEFVLSSIQLLEWLLQNNQFNDLAGFPVKMCNEKWEKIQPGKEPFLCPVSIWNSEFQKYQDLFPNDFILDEIYSGILCDQFILKKITDNKLFYKDPLYYQNDELKTMDIRMMTTNRSDKDNLSKQENAVWKMENEISFSKIAYFNLPKDKNVIDKARGSEKQTKKLLEFIVDVLLIKDELGFTRKEINVKNGEFIQPITIYPSNWLLEIKTRDWVKNKGIPNANRPSVETFLPHFNPSEDGKILYPSLLRSDVARFLHFLEIGVGDLLRNIRSGENEQERINWDQSYVSILMNSYLTPEKVTGLLGDNDFIKAYEEKQFVDKQIRLNQQIGTSVEQAFEAAFNSLPGYKITREPIGSDYIIECDYLHYLIIENENKTKFYIEIKSTVSSEVRMSKTQGEIAYSKKENYILCVVPLNGYDITPENIMKNVKFVTNISLLLKNRVEKVTQFTAFQSETIKITDDDTNDVRTSIDGINVKYVIGQKIWTAEEPTVLTFNSFVKRVTL